MANVTIQEINSGTAATTVTGTDTIEGQEASGGSSKFFTLTTLKNYFLGIIGVWTKNQSVAPSTLTSGTTVNTDASLSNSFKLVLAHNATLANPTNLSNGMVLNFIIKQDGTGSRTLAFGSKFTFLDGSPTTIASAANKVSIISGYYDSTDDLFYCNMSKEA